MAQEKLIYWTQFTIWVIHAVILTLRTPIIFVLKNVIFSFGENSNALKDRKILA
jgi:hypothetical protein